MTENNNIAVQMSIYMRLQKLVRDPIAKMNLKKTGYNKHLNYYYYDLGDFEAQATELFAKADLCPVYYIGFDPQTGVEIATMVITDGLDRIVFQIPTAEVPNMNGVFNLGSKDKYCLRYLLVNHVLMLSEQDEAELSNNEESKNGKLEEKKATPKQIEMIRGLYDDENIAKIIEYYHVANLDELSLKQASEAIQRKRK